MIIEALTELLNDPGVLLDLEQKERARIGADVAAIEVGSNFSPTWTLEEKTLGCTLCSHSDRLRCAWDVLVNTLMHDAAVN